MNGPQRSVYGLAPTEEHRGVDKVPEQPASPSPPKPTVARPSAAPVTVGTLREATRRASTGATQPPRVPITARVKEPDVPARLKQKRKTVAFGVTTNVSQTVERKKDPQPAPVAAPLRTNNRPPTTAAASAAPAAGPTPATKMSLGRVGVGATTRTATRQPSTATPLVAGDEENQPPGTVGGGGEQREERKDSTARLEARVADLERRDRAHKASLAELQGHFEHVIKVVSRLTERIAVLEVEKGGSRSEEDEDLQRLSLHDSTRHRRRLYSDEEEEEEERGRRERERGKKEKRKDGGGRGLLGDDDALRALERQMSSNPVLRRHLLDAIEQDTHQDKYEHEYGERRRTHSPAPRRGGGGSAGLFDEFDDAPPPARAPTGRGTTGGSAPNQRWKEQRHRVTPPGGKGGRGRIDMTRKRSDVTPSRRRVTERVTIEREHHFDDTDESDEIVGDVYTRYDSDQQNHFPQTQYSEEIVEDFNSTAHNNGRRGYGNRNQQHHGTRGGGPMITEMSGSEDEMDRKRRQLKERMEARGRRK